MMTPVLTFCWSVHIHVETQVCADPTLPTAMGSGTLPKRLLSVNVHMAPEYLGNCYKPFLVKNKGK